MRPAVAGKMAVGDGRRRRVRGGLRVLGLCIALVALAEPAWAGDWQRLPAPPLEAFERGDALSSPDPVVDVALDARGNAVAVWSMVYGDEVGVWAAFKPTGGPWGPPELLQVKASLGSLSEARVDMSPEGLAVATWARFDHSEFTPETDAVWAAVKPRGDTSFAAPVELTVAGDPPGASEPDVAVDSSGNAMVVWTKADRSACRYLCGGIRAAARPAGGSFEQLGTLSPPGEPGFGPRVALDGRGRATVVWRGPSSPGELILYAAHRGATGPFDPPQIAARTSGCTALPELEFDHRSTALLVWYDCGRGLRWTSRAWGGSFEPPRDLSSAVSGYALSMTPDGTALVVFRRAERILQWSVRPPGGSFGRPFYLDRTFWGQPGMTASQSDWLGEPTLLTEMDGGVVATWRPEKHWDPSTYQYVLNDPNPRAARFDATAPDPNLIENNGFDTDVAEWNTSGSGAGIVLTREPEGRDGGWAAKLVNTGTAAANCALNDVPVPVEDWTGASYLETDAGTYTGALWVRAENPGQTLRLRLREYSSGTLVGSKSATVVLSPSWQKVALCYVPAAPGASTLDISAYVSAAAPGTCFVADDVSLTFVPTPQPPPAPPPPPDPGLAGNGGFETDRTGWNTSASAAAVSLGRVPDGHSGNWAASVDNRATTAGRCALNDAPNIVTATAPGRYTAAIWVRAEAGGRTLQLRLREYHKTTGALLGTQSTPVELTTSWQKVTASYVPSAPGESTLDLNAYVSEAAPGNCFVADDAAVSLGPVLPEPNLVPNPDFESGSWRWNTSGSASGVTLTRVVGGHSGDWAVKVANTSTSAGTCALNDSPNVVASAADGTYSATMWVRTTTPGQILKLKLREYRAGTQIASLLTAIALTTSWQQVSVTHTPIAPGSSTLDLAAYIADAPPGTCFFADDISIQRG